MGSMQAASFAGAVAEGTTSLDAALTWHLRSNHYPPLPLNLLPVAKRVIEYANKGNWVHNVRLPFPTTWKGKTLAPVSACVEGWHLDSFLAQEDECEDFDESDDDE